MPLSEIVLALLCGGIVSFMLGLVGGGSVIATPLLLYVAGLAPHVAIGTSALATAANALVNLVNHARAGSVRWASALVFAVSGMVGAAIGSSIGKAYDGKRLLFLLALLMLAIGAMMLRRTRPRVNAAPVPVAPAATPRGLVTLAAVAVLTGGVAGFFGIGGGILIVPALLFGTGMPLIAAIGTALLAVACFATTTAVNYALSGLVNWPVAALYIAGGVVGGAAGTAASVRLSGHRTALTRIFAAIIFATAFYMLYRNIGALTFG